LIVAQFCELLENLRNSITAHEHKEAVLLRGGIFVIQLCNCGHQISVRRMPCDRATKQVEKGSVEKVPSFAAKVTCHAHDPRDESPPTTRYVTYRNM